MMDCIENTLSASVEKSICWYASTTEDDSSQKPVSFETSVEHSGSSRLKVFDSAYSMAEPERAKSTFGWFREMSDFDQFSYVAEEVLDFTDSLFPGVMEQNELENLTPSQMEFVSKYFGKFDFGPDFDVVSILDEYESSF